MPPTPDSVNASDPSMLFGAVRGYAGCDVFALSNWLSPRNGQVGCAPFWPINALTAWHRATGFRVRPVEAGDEG